MKASDVMTTKLVAARVGTTAREVGTKLLIGNFNGLPVIHSDIKVIGIVTAVDILRATRQGKNLDSIRAIDIMTQNPVVVKQDTEINEIYHTSKGHHLSSSNKRRTQINRVVSRQNQRIT